jgi:hypothetical protein
MAIPVFTAVAVLIIPVFVVAHFPVTIIIIAGVIPLLGLSVLVSVLPSGRVLLGKSGQGVGQKSGGYQ